MPEDRQREKIILLMVSVVVMIFTVVFLRISEHSRGGNGINIFNMFILIMLALVAVCVYLFVRQ